jgi:hypothetical protein
MKLYVMTGLRTYTWAEPILDRNNWVLKRKRTKTSLQALYRGSPTTVAGYADLAGCVRKGRLIWGPFNLCSPSANPFRANTLPSAVIGLVGQRLKCLFCCYSPLDHPDPVTVVTRPSLLDLEHPDIGSIHCWWANLTRFIVTFCDLDELSHWWFRHIVWFFTDPGAVGRWSHGQVTSGSDISVNLAEHCRY